MGNTQRHWRNNRWNMRKRMRKWRETWRELPLGRSLSYLVISFSAASYTAGFTSEFFFFFSIRVFFHGHWQLTGQQGKGGDHLIPLYNFHPLTNTQTFICNFAPWLSNMSNDCLICLMGKSVSSSPFFPWFPSTHGMLCKMYLNGGWWRVQISYCCLIISWRVSRSHLDIRNVVKRLLFIL